MRPGVKLEGGDLEERGCQKASSSLPLPFHFLGEKRCFREGRGLGLGAAKKQSVGKQVELNGGAQGGVHGMSSEKWAS